MGALRRSARSPRGWEQTQVCPALTLTDLLKVPATAPSPAPPANPYSSTLRWARPTASSRPSEPQGAEGSRRRISTYSAVYRRVDNSAQTRAIAVISSPGLPLDTQWCRELIPALVLRLVPRRLPCALTELSVYALLRADYQQQHAARSELPGDPAPAPRSATVRSEPPGTPDPRLRRRCPQGNTYNTPGGTNSNGGSSYHYSNSNGSYYYANDNGSTYYHPPPSSSAPPVYTPPPSK